MLLSDAGSIPAASTIYPRRAGTPALRATVADVLTQASELAVRVLVVLVLEDEDVPRSPKWLAERMGCSSSYLSKVLGSLTRAGILSSLRGARGGVILKRAPADIPLLAVVEACDGFLVANYCRSLGPQPERVCGFHVAMKEIHESMIDLLTRWTLADLIEVPISVLPDGSVGDCKMAYRGCECRLEADRPGGGGSSDPA